MVGFWEEQLQLEGLVEETGAEDIEAVDIEAVIENKDEEMAVEADEVAEGLAKLETQCQMLLVEEDFHKVILPEEVFLAPLKIKEAHSVKFQDNPSNNQ